MSVKPGESGGFEVMVGLMSMSFTFAGGRDSSQAACIIGSEARSIDAWTSRKPMASQTRRRSSRSKGVTWNGGSGMWRERACAMRRAMLSMVHMRRLWSWERRASWKGRVSGMDVNSAGERTYEEEDVGL